MSGYQDYINTNPLTIDDIDAFIGPGSLWVLSPGGELNYTYDAYKRCLFPKRMDLIHE